MNYTHVYTYINTPHICHTILCMKVINAMEKMKTGQRKRVHASRRGGGTILNSVARKSHYEKAFDFVSFISFFFFFLLFVFVYLFVFVL